MIQGYRPAGKGPPETTALASPAGIAKFVNSKSVNSKSVNSKSVNSKSVSNKSAKP
jgi:hypothetical protein